MSCSLFVMDPEDEEDAAEADASMDEPGESIPLEEIERCLFRETGNW